LLQVTNGFVYITILGRLLFRNNAIERHIHAGVIMYCVLQSCYPRSITIPKKNMTISIVFNAFFICLTLYAWITTWGASCIIVALAYVNLLTSFCFPCKRWAPCSNFPGESQCHRKITSCL